MKFVIYPRSAGKKSKAKQLRKNSRIPIIIYGKKREPESFYIELDDFEANLRKIPKRKVATTIFTLESSSGEKIKAIIKDIHYHPVRYSVEHLDFLEIYDDRKITVNVPVFCTKVNECAGLKMGGALRMIAKTAKVSCLPKDLPSHLDIDVKTLTQQKPKRFNDIVFPSGVHPLVQVKEICVMIAKR